MKTLGNIFKRKCFRIPCSKPAKWPWRSFENVFVKIEKKNIIEILKTIKY